MESNHTELNITMDKSTLRVFHNALLGAQKQWPGGDPREQVLLEDLIQETFRALLEYEFEEED